MDLHEIARQVALTAGADFAFVLSQAGLLVTKDAPRDMPDRGRMKILWACPAGKSGEVAHIELPRDDLVPFGGAAPVDVFATRVEDTAILVVVLASWNDKGQVVLALTAGAEMLAEMIRAARSSRAQKGSGKKGAEARRAGAGAGAAAVPAEVRRERTTIPFEPVRRERSSAAPPPAGKRERTGMSVMQPVSAKRERSSALPKAPKEGAKKAARARPSEGNAAARGAVQPSPRVSSSPDIEIGEADVGRETMLAIEAFRPRGRSEPEIVLGEAPVGRETMIAIAASQPRSRPGPAPEGMRVQLASISRESMLEVERVEASQRGRPTVDEPLVTERRTLPWVDSPAALKRTLEARETARAAAPPEVKLAVEDMDPDAMEELLGEGNRR